MWYNDIMDKKTIILVALAIIAIPNIASFALMGHDKRCARLKSHRDFKSGRSRTADGSNRRLGAQRRRQREAARLWEGAVWRDNERDKSVCDQMENRV